MRTNYSRIFWAALLAPLMLAAGIAGVAAEGTGAVQTRFVDRPQTTLRIWRSAPPADCPLPKSGAIAGIGFTGKHAEYCVADTWYPSWAADGNLYSPYADGTVNGLLSCCWGEKPSTGQAKIVGEDPMRLEIVDQAVHADPPAPYGGRYPCGSLVYNGIWYYGTYCLNNEGNSTQPMVTVGGQNYNWGVLGPFVGFRTSKDLGKTWTETRHTPAKPIFGEPSKLGGKVKIGAPHFVDFGKNMEHSPDGKAYLVAQGAADPDPKPRLANLSWISADQVYLLRVTPSVETINDASQYEFFAGHDKKGEPVWTHDFSRIKPLVDWNNHCGTVTVTYDAPLKKYLMCIVDGWPTTARMSTAILESDRITGPWKLASYLKDFGSQAYFTNIPSKFISADGRNAWLCYSANFTNTWMEGKDPIDPPGSGYKMCLQQIRLIGPGEAKVSGPLSSEENIARLAAVTASPAIGVTQAAAVVDGAAEGYPKGDSSREWASNGEGNKAMLRLTWNVEVGIDKVWLFDRQNAEDQITSGVLLFSDGSTIPVGALPDGTAKGLEVRFPKKKVSWLIFAVTGAKSAGANTGLTEIAVFGERGGH